MKPTLFFTKSISCYFVKENSIKLVKKNPSFLKDFKIIFDLQSLVNK